MRKSFLPWLACAVLSRHRGPGARLGSAGARRRSVANAAFVVGDNFFTGREPVGARRPLGDDRGRREGHVQRRGRAAANNGVHNVDFDFGPAADVCNQTVGARRRTPWTPTASRRCQRSRAARLGGRVHVQHAGHLQVLLSKPTARMEGTVVVSGTATPTPTPDARRRRPRRRRPRRPRRHRRRRRQRRRHVTPTGPRITAHDSGIAELVAGRVVVQRHRRQRDDHGRRAGHVRLPGGHELAQRRVQRRRRSRRRARRPRSRRRFRSSTPTTRRRCRASRSPPGWEGYCQFDAPGTYSFVCGAHPEMTGTVDRRARGDADTDADTDTDTDAHADADADADADATPTPTPTPHRRRRRRHTHADADADADTTPTPTPTPTPTARRRRPRRRRRRRPHAHADADAPTPTPTPTRRRRRPRRPPDGARPATPTGNVPTDARAHARRDRRTSAPITPGVADDYDATCPALVTSTAGNATLSVSDPGDAVGQLINGTLAFARRCGSRRPTRRNADVGVRAGDRRRQPADAAHLAEGDRQRRRDDRVQPAGLRQRAAAGGAYSKTITFTL